MRKGLVYVTGGARSGKSTFAEGLIMEQGHRILYIATAVPFDNEMRDRIKKHRQQRPSFWRTLEAYRGIGESLENRGERFHGILLDCVTVMITNLMMDLGCDGEGFSPERTGRMEAQVMAEVDSAIAGIRKWGELGVIVTNEVGMGLVPDNPLGRVFRDIAGRVNQHIAAEADSGYMMVSGIPLRLK
jgi:adenosylcobinamide kinase/adenosylcobinamide-phosphate guanylyltransferase